MVCQYFLGGTGLAQFVKTHLAWFAGIEECELHNITSAMASIQQEYTLNKSKTACITFFCKINFFNYLKQWLRAPGHRNYLNAIWQEKQSYQSQGLPDCLKKVAYKYYLYYLFIFSD